jgi:sortase A
MQVRVLPRTMTLGDRSQTGGARKVSFKSWRRVEKVFLIAGVSLLLAYGSIRLYQQVSTRAALARFHEAVAERDANRTPSAALPGDGDVDFSLWNPKRIQAYRQSLAAKTDVPVAVLGIEKLNLEVPVYDGTDDLTLNRGVGRIIGTAKAGEMGNTGIAGHRDGFFRGLKDIAVGDKIELVTADRTIEYAVSKTEIVQPDNVSVLAKTSNASLTLVTCYPFYFVGNAPQRFVVQAIATDFDGPNENSGPSSTTVGDIKSKEKRK